MTETVETDEGILVDSQGNEVTVDDAEKSSEKPADGEKPVERPEWLPEKFKAPEDLAKSYSELEKALKEKGKLAPDEYVIDDKEAIQFDPEDDVYKGFIDLAKGSNMSNQQFNAVLKYASDAGILAPQIDYEAEKAALGGDADKIISSLQSFSSTRLSEKERETLESIAITAESTKLLYKLIRMGDKSVPARPGDSSGDDRKGLEGQLQTLLGASDIKTNRQKQAEAIELTNRIAAL